MATTITLSVNAQPALNDLYKFNQVINEVKMNSQSISIGTPGKTTGAGMTVIAKEIQTAKKQVDKLGNASDKHTKSLRSSLAALSKEGKKALGDISKFATGMLSWWTALIVAVELATKTFTYFFVNLTQSIPKLIAKMDNLVKATDRQVQAFEKNKKQSAQLMKSLQVLASKQSLTNSEQLYAQSIIEKLSKRYKDLKVIIDQTTGAIKNYSDIQYQIDEQDRKRELNLTKRQIFAQRQLANAKLAETFGTDKVSLDKGVSGRDFFTFAENAFGELSQIDRDRLAKQWNQGDLKAKRKILEDLSTDYSNNEQVVTRIGAAIDALDKLIDLQQKFNDLNSASSRIIASENKALEQNKEIVKEIGNIREKGQSAQRELLKAQEEQYFNSLQTNEQKAEYLKGVLDQLSEDADKVNEEIKKKADQLQHHLYLKDASTTQTSSIKTQMDQNDASVAKVRQNITDLYRDFKRVTGQDFKLDFLSKQNQQDIIKRISQIKKEIQSIEFYNYRVDTTDLKNEQTQLQKQLQIIQQINSYNLDISKLTKQREELVEQLNSSLQIGSQNEKISLQSEKELEELKTSEAEKQLQIQEKRAQLAALQKAIAEERLNQQQRMQDIYKDYETQLDNLNKSEEEIALDTALANAQRAKGAELTEQQIEKVTKYVEKLQAMKKILEEQEKTEKVQGIFKGYQQDQSVQYLKIIGAQKEAVLLEARLNAQKAKGAKLTDDELKSLEGYLNMQQLLDQALAESNIQPQLMNTGTISNQLAKKGGFASSVVTDRAQDINAQILKTQNKQYDVQKSIKDAVEKYSVIQ